MVLCSNPANSTSKYSGSVENVYPVISNTLASSVLLKVLYGMIHKNIWETCYVDSHVQKFLQHLGIR